MKSNHIHIRIDIRRDDDVIIQKCSTHITVINATWFNFKHFLFGVPLQISSLWFSLYTVCLLFKCICGLKNMSKDKNLP